MRQRALRMPKQSLVWLLLLSPGLAPLPANQREQPRANRAADIWSYRMRGNLDEKNLSCRGSAAVTMAESEGSSCVRWKVAKQQCIGSNAVDWLHEGQPGGQICLRRDEWALRKHLPGRAFCLPRVVSKDGRLVSFSISCTWECRSAKNPCAGQATYEFSRD